MNYDGKAARGRRRMQDDRMKGRARRFSKINDMPEDHLVPSSDHLAMCSCPGCGNRRRAEGDSMSERRFADHMRAAILEIGDRL